MSSAWSMESGEVLLEVFEEVIYWTLAVERTDVLQFDDVDFFCDSTDEFLSSIFCGFPDFLIFDFCLGDEGLLLFEFCHA